RYSGRSRPVSRSTTASSTSGRWAGPWAGGGAGQALAARARASRAGRIMAVLPAQRARCMDANARGRAAGLHGAPVRLCGHSGFRFEPASRMSKTRVLTGITTSGTPHLGNYVGAIRPAIAASRASGAESFYFLADYHSLIKAQDPARTQRSTLEIAAAWLACGLDPDKVWFYRESDIP